MQSPGACPLVSHPGGSRQQHPGPSAVGSKLFETLFCFLLPATNQNKALIPCCRPLPCSLCSALQQAQPAPASGPLQLLQSLECPSHRFPKMSRPPTGSSLSSCHLFFSLCRSFCLPIVYCQSVHKRTKSSMKARPWVLIILGPSTPSACCMVSMAGTHCCAAKVHKAKGLGTAAVTQFPGSCAQSMEGLAG